MVTPVGQWPPVAGLTRPQAVEVAIYGCVVIDRLGGPGHQLNGWIEKVLEQGPAYDALGDAWRPPGCWKIRLTPMIELFDRHTGALWVYDAATMDAVATVILQRHGRDLSTRLGMSRRRCFVNNERCS